MENGRNGCIICQKKHALEVPVAIMKRFMGIRTGNHAIAVVVAQTNH